MAFSIAESFVPSTAFVLFVTHYPQLTSLADMYANVKNVHMKTTIEIADDTTASPGLKFLHTVAKGPYELKHGYGIMMAEKAGFPPEVLVEARRVQRIVREQYPILFEVTAVDDIARVRKELLQHLLILRSCRLDDAGLRHYLHTLRSKIPPEVAAALIAATKLTSDEDLAPRPSPERTLTASTLEPKDKETIYEDMENIRIEDIIPPSKRVRADLSNYL